LNFEYDAEIGQNKERFSKVSEKNKEIIMQPKCKCRIILVSILTVVFLSGTVMIGSTWAEKAKSRHKKIGQTVENDKTPGENPAKKIQMTGIIDRIGSDDIVIGDTWFKLSGNVSASGFKVGDAVEVVADSKYELIQLRPKGAAPKE
jgi:hypothetical protein